MLYLIRTFGLNKRTSLKIGFTTNIKKRINNYIEHNPFVELISTRDGSLMDELILHLYLESKGYKENFLDEWFKDDPIIYYYFHKNTESLLSLIWKDRDNLFFESDFIGKNINSLKINLYKYLKEKYKLENNFNRYKQIDKVFLFSEAKEKLKNINDYEKDFGNY